MPLPGRIPSAPRPAVRGAARAGGGNVEKPVAAPESLTPAVSPGLAQRSATDPFPQRPAPEPRRPATTLRRGARPARTALICVGGYGSIQSGAGRLWTNKWAAQRAGRATKPIRATLFLTLLISASGDETQPERIRKRLPRPVRKASRGRPGFAGALPAGFSSKKAGRPVSYPVRHDVRLPTKRRDGCMS
jgi:hypothetical protein